MEAVADLSDQETTLLLLGFVAAILSFFAYLPYVLDTVARRTQPHRATWLIWSVLSSIALLTQIHEGATTSLWFASVQVAATLIVFGLSVRSGSGTYLGKSDYCILLISAAGLVLWYLTDTAVYALAISISISALGGLVTVLKAYRDPDSETLSTWIISMIASVCAVLCIGEIDWVILAYPLYLVTLYSALIAAIVIGYSRQELHHLKYCSQLSTKQRLRIAQQSGNSNGIVSVFKTIATLLASHHKKIQCAGYRLATVTLIVGVFLAGAGIDYQKPYEITAAVLFLASSICFWNYHPVRQPTMLFFGGVGLTLAGLYLTCAGYYATGLSITSVSLETTRGGIFAIVDHCESSVSQRITVCVFTRKTLRSATLLFGWYVKFVARISSQIKLRTLVGKYKTQPLI